MLTLMVGGWRRLLLTAVAVGGMAVASHAQDGGSAGAKANAAAPAQPVAFDHKLHTQAAKMTCNDCHAPRGDGTTVAMPQAPKCMVCHTSVAADKPDIQRLATAAKNEDPIAWVRVYRVPSFVTFSHKTHAGSTCEECHGPVAEQTAISLWKDTHMGTCIACHQAKQAPAGCDTCHAVQSRNGQSPFAVDGTTLARLRLAGARSVLMGNVRSTQPFVGVTSFLRVPAL